MADIRDVRLITKRTSVPGKIPTGTTGDESSFIRAGELASNLADHSLWGYDGTSVFEYGSSSFLGLTGGTISGNVFISGGLSATTLSGGTITGPTNFVAGLTADTITSNRLTINTTAVSGVEICQQWQVSDADSYVRLENATSSATQFIPAIIFYQPSLTANIAAFISSRVVDTGTQPTLVIDGRTIANTALVNRPVLRIRNFSTQIVDVTADGLVGINTTAPTERLDVNGSIRTRNSIKFGDTAKSIDGGTGAVMTINSGINSMVFRGTSNAFMRGTHSGGIGIEITTGTTTIANSAILTLTSTSKGFLPPRMTTAERNVIASPAVGLVIYNIDVNSLQSYNGSNWDSLVPSSFTGGTVAGPTTFTSGLSSSTISATTFFGSGAGLTGLPSATFTGGTVSGPTTFTGGLSATSISATTIVGPQPYTLSVQALTSTPADAATIYFGNLPKAPVTTPAISKVFIPKSGTIKIANIYCYAGTAGTAENWSAYIRLNNTTDTLIETIGASTNERIFNNESLNITVVAGDYIEIKMINPTWVTNPATAIFGGYIYIE